MKTKTVYEECYAIYQKGGYAPVIDHVEKQIKNENPKYKDVDCCLCGECNNTMPTLNDICLVCGQSTFYKQEVIDKVIEQIKEDIANGDVEALDEMLKFMPIRYLEGYLPLEENLEIDLSSNNIFD